jgi:hypothetical protein
MKDQLIAAAKAMYLHIDIQEEDNRFLLIQWTVSPDDTIGSLASTATIRTYPRDGIYMTLYECALDKMETVLNKLKELT